MCFAQLLKTDHEALSLSLTEGETHETVAEDTMRKLRKVMSFGKSRKALPHVCKRRNFEIAGAIGICFLTSYLNVIVAFARFRLKKSLHQETVKV